MFSKFYGDGADIYKALEKEFDVKEFIDIDYIGGKLGLALTLHQTAYEIIDKNRLRGLLDRYHNDILMHWDNYISLRDRALVGYAHGVSALVHHLGNCLLPGSDVDKELAEKLLHKVWQYDRSCKMAGTNQWTDNRFITDEPLNRSWCHGLPGVGISRLGLLPIQKYCSHAKADLAFILQTLGSESHTHGSHHLCCGDCGEIDFLIEASKIDEFKEVSEQLLGIRTRSLLESIGNAQLFHGTVGSIKFSLAPDLFQGAAGIGYTLLRIQNRDLPVVY
jgi:lantibiotic modifying enzyme